MFRTILCLTLVLSFVTAATAQSQAYFVEVDNSRAAADPYWVEGTRTYDLVVEVVGSYWGRELDWAGCEFFAQAIGDSWYDHPLGTDYPPPPEQFELYPALEFDSYYCAADTDLSDGAPTPLIEHATTTVHVKDAAWFDTQETGNGTFVIARFSITPCPSGGSTWGGGEFWLLPGHERYYFGPLSPPPCIGDLDYDGLVDLSDLAILLASYRLDDGGDLNCDGETDLADLAELLANYGCDMYRS